MAHEETIEEYAAAHGWCLEKIASLEAQEAASQERIAFLESELAAQVSNLITIILMSFT